MNKARRKSRAKRSTVKLHDRSVQAPPLVLPGGTGVFAGITVPAGRVDVAVAKAVAVSVTETIGPVGVAVGV